MEYKYAPKKNYEDFASGRVLYHKSGLSTFPVRLASEIFLRCLAYRERKEELILYDPLCGEAYLLTVLGLLHPTVLSQVIGSDIDPEVLQMASKNFSLLHKEGLLERQNQLEKLYQSFGKASHRGALESVAYFLNEKSEHQARIKTRLFKADLLRPDALHKKDFKADIVISDVPYGGMVSWTEDLPNNIGRLLRHLRPVLSSQSILAIVSDKSQKIITETYRRLERFKAGKRKIEIFQLERP